MATTAENPSYWEKDYDYTRAHECIVRADSREDELLARKLGYKKYPRFRVRDLAYAWRERGDRLVVPHVSSKVEGV